MQWVQVACSVTKIKYVKMIECQDADPSHVDTNWEACGQRAGIDTAAIKSCISDRGQRLLHLAALMVQHGAKNRAADFQVRRRLVEHARRELRNTRLARELASGGRTNLRKAIGFGRRNGQRVELRFLTDQPGEKVGIQVAVLRSTHQVRAVRQGEEEFPIAARRRRHG